MGNLDSYRMICQGPEETWNEWRVVHLLFLCSYLMFSLRCACCKATRHWRLALHVNVFFRGEVAANCIFTLLCLSLYITEVPAGDREHGASGVSENKVEYCYPEKGKCSRQPQWRRKSLTSLDHESDGLLLLRAEPANDEPKGRAKCAHLPPCLTPPHPTAPGSGPPPPGSPPLCLHSTLHSPLSCLSALFIDCLPTCWLLSCEHKLCPCPS